MQDNCPRRIMIMQTTGEKTEAANPLRPMKIGQHVITELQLAGLPGKIPTSVFVTASLYRILQDEQFEPAVIDTVLKRILHRWRTEGFLVQAKRTWFWHADSQSHLCRVAKQIADRATLECSQPA